MERLIRRNLRQLSTFTKLECRVRLPVLHHLLQRRASQIVKGHSTSSETPDKPSEGALKGVKILDLSRVLAVRTELPDFVAVYKNTPRK
jgi:hypothetical protein